MVVQGSHAIINLAHQCTVLQSVMLYSTAIDKPFADSGACYPRCKRLPRSASLGTRRPCRYIWQEICLITAAPEAGLMQSYMYMEDTDCYCGDHRSYLSVVTAAPQAGLICHIIISWCRRKLGTYIYPQMEDTEAGDNRCILL